MTPFVLLALTMLVFSLFVIVDASSTTAQPTTSAVPTRQPTTAKPTKKPDAGQPTNKPVTNAPQPIPLPTAVPSVSPTNAPVNPPNFGQPTYSPSEIPTGQPTSMPSTLSENEEHSEDFSTYSDDIIAAAKSGAVSIVADYINEMGVEEATKSNFAYTAVASAILGGYLPIVKTIYDKTNIPVDSVGKSGNTALMWASYYGNIDVVQYLLEKEADFTVSNNNGETALSLARNSGHDDVVLLLRSYGALN